MQELTCLCPASQDRISPLACPERCEAKSKESAESFHHEDSKSRREKDIAVPGNQDAGNQDTREKTDNLILNALQPVVSEEGKIPYIDYSIAADRSYIGPWTVGAIL